jgi:branched-chain amino acid transport system substrate-binding protein
MPGVTETSIKVGQTIPYSGPNSAYGVRGSAEAAFFKMLNAGGGVSPRMFDLLAVNGRTIEFLSVDDGYDPRRTVQETLRLVEDEGVAFTFSSLGTATQTVVRQYLNLKHVPQLFVSSGAEKWGDYEHYPWTMGWQPSYRVEARIYAKHLQQEVPGAKLAILYQNDDFGKGYLVGLKDALGPKYDQVVVRAASYDATDPTVDSQVANLQGSGAEALLTVAGPKSAVQVISKLAAIDWHPSPHYLTTASASAAAVMIPAGVEKGRGILTASYLKDPTDPQWTDDPGMDEWRAFMKQWMPEGDIKDLNAVCAYGAALTIKRVLEQCGDDLSRENIMHQAANLHDLELPVLLPGIKVNTSPTNYHPIRRMRLARWTGSSWELVREVLD